LILLFAIAVNRSDDMKKLGSLFLLLIVLAVFGCASPLDKSKAASLTHIHIVPILGGALPSKGQKVFGVIHNFDIPYPAASLITNYKILDPIDLAVITNDWFSGMPEEERQRILMIKDIEPSDGGGDEEAEANKLVGRKAAEYAASIAVNVLFGVIFARHGAVAPFVMLRGGEAPPDIVLKKERRRNVRMEEVVSFLNENEIWVPTVEIAEETMRQLKSGYKYSVSVDPEIKPLPGIESLEDMKTTDKMKTPKIRMWYDMDQSSFDYSEQPSSGAVLEISKENYIFNEKAGYPGATPGGVFSMHIYMKLIDPVSRSVIANADCRYFGPNLFYNRIKMEELFTNAGANFKKIFREAATEIVPQCIESLGLQKK
jgi:hypothetical protein